MTHCAPLIRGLFHPRGYVYSVLLARSRCNVASGTERPSGVITATVVSNHGGAGGIRTITLPLDGTVTGIRCALLRRTPCVVSGHGAVGTTSRPLCHEPGWHAMEKLSDPSGSASYWMRPAESAC